MKWPAIGMVFVITLSAGCSRNEDRQSAPWQVVAVAGTRSAPSGDGQIMYSFGTPTSPPRFLRLSLVCTNKLTEKALALFEVSGAEGQLKGQTYGKLFSATVTASTNVTLYFDESMLGWPFKSGFVLSGMDHSENFRTPSVVEAR